MLNYKRFTFNYRHSVFYCISKYYLRKAPHFRHDDADARSRSLYYLEAARSCRCEDDTGVCQNHQSEKGWCRQSCKRVVRLVDVNRSIVECYKMVLFPCLHMAKFRFTLIRVRIGKKQSKVINHISVKKRLCQRLEIHLILTTSLFQAFSIRYSLGVHPAIFLNQRLKCCG